MLRWSWEMPLSQVLRGAWVYEVERETSRRVHHQDSTCEGPVEGLPGSHRRLGVSL